MKKKITAIVAIALCFIMVMPVALADVGDRRMTIGADLTDAQRTQIYQDFNVSSEDEIKEISVTNADERAYLQGLVPDGKIGKVALSCIYIEILQQGTGLTISTNNINWCTSEMYRNALATAGIVDAKVMVSAPFEVSGTAALTGVYKAYEDITGQELSALAKELGVEELVLTGNLADMIGKDQAALLVAELKKILDQTQNMSGDEVKAEIRNIAKTYNISITDAQVDQLYNLCRSLEKLDVNELQGRLETLAKTIQGAKEAEKQLSSFAQGVKTFFSSIGDFFSRLFGGK